MNNSTKSTSIVEKEETLEILNHIHKTSKISQRSLSNELDVSLGKINFLIKELSKKGWIKFKRASKSKNKLHYIYILTPEGIKQRGILTKKFLERKIDQYDRLTEEIKKLQKAVKET